MRIFLLNLFAAGLSFAQPHGLGGGSPVLPQCTATRTNNCTPAVSTCYLIANIGATSSATPANLCAGWPMAANKSYALHCQINVTFVASATVAFALAGPGNPAHWAMSYGGLTGAAAAWESKSVTGTTSYSALTTSAPGGVTATVILDAAITNGVTASGANLTLKTQGNGTNTYNVLADSYCTATQIN